MRFLGREVMPEMRLRELVSYRFVAYDIVQAGLPGARHERHFRPVDGGFHYGVVAGYETRPGPAASSTGPSSEKEATAPCGRR